MWVIDRLSSWILCQTVTLQCFWRVICVCILCMSATAIGPMAVTMAVCKYSGIMNGGKEWSDTGLGAWYECV